MQVLRTGKLATHGRSGLLAIAVVVTLAAALVAAASVLLRSPGATVTPAAPLVVGDSYRVTFPAADGDTVRWDVALPFNPTQADIKLRSIELVGAHGLEVLGIVLSYPTLQADGVCLSAGNLPGFPPPGVYTAAIDGALLPPATQRTCSNYPTIVVGLRRPPGIASGTIDAVRVRYDYLGRSYELELPQSFELRRR